MKRRGRKYRQQQLQPDEHTAEREWHTERNLKAVVIVTKVRIIVSLVSTCEASTQKVPHEARVRIAMGVIIVCK